jgi:preprotein translocase subunit SecG
MDQRFPIRTVLIITAIFFLASLPITLLVGYVATHEEQNLGDMITALIEMVVGGEEFPADVETEELTEENHTDAPPPEKTISTTGIILLIAFIGSLLGLPFLLRKRFIKEQPVILESTEDSELRERRRRRRRQISTTE